MTNLFPFLINENHSLYCILKSIISSISLTHISNSLYCCIKSTFISGKLFPFSISLLILSLSPNLKYKSFNIFAFSSQTQLASSIILN